jgi:S1-C subfamily serine protease
VARIDLQRRELRVLRPETEAAFTMRPIQSAVAFVTGLLLGACITPTPVFVTSDGETSREAAARELESKTVALVGVEQKIFCSGVWVSDKAILTAYHCIADEKYDGFKYAVYTDFYLPGTLRENAHVAVRLARLAATDQEHDLALLRALDPPLNHGVAKVALDTIRAGSFVSTMGHPLRLGWSYSSGQVAAIREYNIEGHDILAVQATTPISRGNSGGGLFDIQNSLVGVVHGCINVTGVQHLCTHMNLFVHAQYIRDFLVKTGDL